jgi:formylglycine-generating enzyme required for sulfatase activity
MKRRKFLKSSAVGAGMIVADLSLGSPDARPTTAAASRALPPASTKLVEIPGTSFEVVDGVTTVPVTVTLGRFWISPTELTQSELEAVMGYNPSFHKGPDLPVESVTWWEAIRYCNLRSLGENLEPCYNLETGACDMEKNGYRLPTDAEWTHAADLPAKPSPADMAGNLGSPDTKNVERLLDELKTASTKPVASYPPNRYGLYDRVGNVWEWCTDYFNPVRTVQTSYNPAGALRGLARVIRGGSFISTTSASWARGYHSSMEPEYKSRFTGFRVCRTGEPKAVLPAVHQDAKWFEPYHQPPAGYETSTGDLSSLVAGVSTLADWENRRQAIKTKWLNLLGNMEIEPPPSRTRLVETVADQNYTGKLMYLQVEPDWWEKVLIMMPATDLERPRPVVIVPFYDVDTYAAVQKGYIAVSIRWYLEGYGEGYGEGVANLKLRHPHCAGLGKWVWDAHRLIDYLYTLPEVDRERIGIIGHSLGGKMALYASAFDDRIAAVVSNEGGIGLSFSNYEDYWYFGDVIRKQGKATDQHELLALIAPRPFLLLGGDAYDTAKSWYYINAARKVYERYGKPQNIGYFNHHKGHMPTPEAVWRAMEWLAHFLGPVS